MAEVDCQICHHIAGGINDAIHELDILPQPDVDSSESTALTVLAALTQDQIDEMAGELDSNTPDCRPNCAVRKFLWYVLIAQKPKSPSDEQPPLSLE